MTDDFGRTSERVLGVRAGLADKVGNAVLGVLPADLPLLAVNRLARRGLPW